MKKYLCMLLAFLLIAPALAETVQDQALAFIQDADIAADSVRRIGSDVIISPANGGTATLDCPGDFDPLNLSWHFDGAADEDVALYLDHALGLLVGLEKKLPADTENLSVAEAMRARNYGAMVENGLEGLEVLGEQGMRVLIAQLFWQDNSELNSFRARLIGRIMQPEEAAE